MGSLAPQDGFQVALLVGSDDDMPEGCPLKAAALVSASASPTPAAHRPPPALSAPQATQIQKTTSLMQPGLSSQIPQADFHKFYAPRVSYLASSHLPNPSYENQNQGCR